MATNKEILFILKMQNAAKATINEVRQGMGGMAAEATKAQAAVKGMNNALAGRGAVTSLSATIGKLKSLGSEITSVKNIAHGMAGGIIGGLITYNLGIAAGRLLIRTIKDAISTYADFEKEMSMVKAITGATTDQFNQLSAAAQMVGAKTEFTATQAAQGLEYLSRAGLNSQEAIAALPDTVNLASASAIDLGKAADITSSVLRTFGLSANQTGQVVDVLATVAARTNTNVSQLGQAMRYAGTAAAAFGIDINQTAAAVGTLSDLGIKATKAGTTIQQALVKATEVVSGQATKKAMAAFASLHINKDQFDPSKVGIIGMIKALKDANASKDQLLAIFKSRQFAGIEALIRNYDKLTAVAKEAANSQGAAAKQAATARDNLATDWKVLISTIQAADIQIGQSIGPALRMVVQFSANVVAALFGVPAAFAKFQEGAKAVAVAIKSIVAAFLILKAVSIVSWFAEATLGAVTFTGVLDVIPAAFELISAAIYSIPIIGWIAAAVAAILYLKDVTFQWGGTTISVGQVVSQAFSDVLAYGRRLWAGLGDVFKNIQALWNRLVGNLSADAPRWGVIFGAISKAMDTVWKAMLTGYDHIIGGFVGLVNATKVILGNLKPVMIASFEAAWNAVVDIMQRGINMVLGGFRDMLSGIDKLGSKVGLKLDLASSVGKVNLSSIKSAVNQQGADTAQAAAKAFSDGLNSKYATDAANAVSNIVTKTVVPAAKDAATTVLNQTAAAAENAASDRALIARVRAAQAAKGTKPLSTDTNNATTNPTLANSKAAKALYEVYGKVIDKAKEQVTLSHYAGRAYDIQKAALDAINAAKQKGITLTQQQLENIKKATGEALDAKAAHDYIQKFSDTLHNQIVSGLESALDQGKLDLKSFVSTLGQQLRNTAIENFVNILFKGGNGGGGGLDNLFQSLRGGSSGGGSGGGFLSSIFGSIFGGGGGAASVGATAEHLGGAAAAASGGGLFATIGSFLTSLFADGGIMTSGGRLPLNTYSGGGIANSPQLALFGEGRVPEAYVPVPSGRIPVEMRGHTGGNQYHAHFVIQTPNADSFRKSQDQIMADAQRQLHRMGQRNN